MPQCKYEISHSLIILHDKLPIDVLRMILEYCIRPIRVPTLRLGPWHCPIIFVNLNNREIAYFEWQHRSGIFYFETEDYSTVPFASITQTSRPAIINNSFPETFQHVLWTYQNSSEWDLQTNQTQCSRICSILKNTVKHYNPMFKSIVFVTFAFSLIIFLSFRLWMLV